MCHTLGRRWRKDDPDFWRRLSPLGAGRHGPSEEEGPIEPQSADPTAEAFAARLRRLREAGHEKARGDAVAFRSAYPDRDLRSSAIDGSMDVGEDDVEEERWQ